MSNFNTNNDRNDEGIKIKTEVKIKERAKSWESHIISFVCTSSIDTCG